MRGFSPPSSARFARMRGFSPSRSSADGRRTKIELRSGQVHAGQENCQVCMKFDDFHYSFRQGGRNPILQSPSADGAPVVGRPHTRGDRRIADSIRVVHPEGAHRGAAGSQILFVFCIQKAPKGRSQFQELEKSTSQPGACNPRT